MDISYSRGDKGVGTGVHIPVNVSTGVKQGKGPGAGTNPLKRLREEDDQLQSDV